MLNEHEHSNNIKRKKMEEKEVNKYCKLFHSYIIVVVDRANDINRLDTTPLRIRFASLQICAFSTIWLFAYSRAIFNMRCVCYS